MWRSWAGGGGLGLEVEVLGWSWMYVKLSETPLEAAYGREMNIQFTGDSSGGYSCSQHENFNILQNL